MPTSPFEALIEDLAAVQAARTVRENAARAARHHAEAQRNRRLAQQQQRPLRKSEPVPVPNYTPDWDGLAARQERIAADLERSRIAAQKQAIREHLATLRQAAKAGRLSSHDAALYDVYRGQAARMGLTP